MNAILPAAASDAYCASCVSGSQTAVAIACTLESAEFQERVESIRDLARRSLRSSRRENLRLHLTYGPEARAEVEAMVASESECCAFLTFAVRSDKDGVGLTITAPIAALAAANELFAHFAPDLALKAA